MRLNREADTCVPVTVFLSWLYRNPASYPQLPLKSLSPLMPMVLSHASVSLSNKRFPNSARRARVSPEIICSKGLKGLNASAGTPVSAWVGVFGGSAPGTIGECGGMARVVWPFVWNEPVAGGDAALCGFTFL